MRSGRHTEVACDLAIAEPHALFAHGTTCTLHRQAARLSRAVWYSQHTHMSKLQQLQAIRDQLAMLMDAEDRDTYPVLLHLDDLIEDQPTSLQSMVEG